MERCSPHAFVSAFHPPSRPLSLCRRRVRMRCTACASPTWTSNRQTCSSSTRSPLTAPAPHLHTAAKQWPQPQRQLQPQEPRPRPVRQVAVRVRGDGTMAMCLPLLAQRIHRPSARGRARFVRCPWQICVCACVCVLPSICPWLPISLWLAALLACKKGCISMPLSPTSPCVCVFLVHMCVCVCVCVSRIKCL